MLLRLALLTLIAVPACTHRPVRVGLPAPDPHGCYIVIYDQVSFQGVGDVLNGPRRLPYLEQLTRTNEEDWRNRIRSLRVGSSATVTVYTDTEFKGASRRFAPETEHPRLEQQVSGKIESLVLTCAPRVVQSVEMNR